MITIPYREYEDKVLAAWLGKSIGGVVGANVENHKERKDLTTEQLWPSEIPPNDDLDIQLVWLEAFQELGCYLTQEDLVRYWQDRCWYNFCEYGFFLYNVQRGIHPPVSGFWNNDYFRESEGCPIRSDIWGLVAPGNPQLAAAMAKMDGELDHSGFSVEAEMFYAALTAASFTAANREELIAAALSVLPANSQIREVVAVTRRITTQFPEFSQAWQLVMRNFGDRDASKALTNLAIVMMCWFLSEDDFVLAMRHCVNSGWDTDCTAATLGAIFGSWKGTQCIPDQWRTQLGSRLVCGIEVKHQNALLESLGAETALVGLEMSLCRNRAVRLSHAPPLTPRAEPQREFEFTVSYPAEPVLSAAEPAKAIIQIRNLSSKSVTCNLNLTALEQIENFVCSLSPAQISLQPGQSIPVTAEVCRLNPSLPLADKNRFALTGAGSEAWIFGFGGARQYLVYGPYWNMWDHRKFAECPYSNAQKRCNPYAVGCGADSYNHYVDLDFEYLDEARLVHVDIPEAVPRHLQIGTDRVPGEAMGNWLGQSCYYLVREFILPQGARIVLMCGRTGSLKVWLDGELRGRFDEEHLWAPCDQDRISFVGTGKPQRLVVKLLNTGERGALSFYFLREEEHGKEGISYLSDAIVDLIPQCGCVF